MMQSIVISAVQKKLAIITFIEKLNYSCKPQPFIDFSQKKIS